MNGRTLYAATDYYRPFPDPRQVFRDRVEEHCQYLLPIGTLSLSHLSRDWTGDIHIVAPIEPLPGYGVSGEESDPFHNHLCRPNWLGYFLRENKIELASDFRIFHKAYYVEHLPRNQTRQGEAAELASHYAETQQRFAARARHYQTHGWLCQDPDNWHSSMGPPEQHRGSLVRDLGGVSFESNWSRMLLFPVSKYPDQFVYRGEVYECDRVLPQTEDGRDFTYVCEVELWNYTGDTNGVLVVFYDPQDQIVLTTIDWS